MAERMTRGMTQDEIRAMLDRNLARAFEIYERAVARRAAELAAMVSAPTPAPVLPAEDAKPVRPRIGYRMRELRDIVSAAPGISRSDALRAAGLPTRGLGSGRELNRAIAAGLVIVEHEHARRCRLFASERDRRRWHLAREALTQGTPAGRVAEIRAEITALDAERVATWSTTS